MRPLPEWQRQAIVRAIVMDELKPKEIAAELGVSVNMVREVKRQLDMVQSETPNARCG